MSKIVYVAGIGETAKEKEGRLNLHLPVENMTDFDMELAIRKQREEIQKGIVERLSGIGCSCAEKHNDKLDIIKSMIDIRSDNSLSEAEKVSGIGTILEMVESGEFENAKTIAGIGNVHERYLQRQQMLQNRLNRVRQKIRAGHQPQVGKIQLKKVFKKAAEGIKKVSKAVLKVATAPARLAIKGILEVALPKMAPSFLYLFIKDQNLVAKLPEKARRKRKKSEVLAKFIVQGVGMKEDHFMGIVRNGIMKRFGKSPEDVIRQQMQGRMSGIGDVGIIDDIVKVVFSVLKQIGKLFKKKQPAELDDYSGNDMPDPSDFGSMSETEKTSYGNEIRNQEQSSGDEPGESTDSKSTKMC
jgi:hypothetical protein